MFKLGLKCFVAILLFVCGLPFALFAIMGIFVGLSEKDASTRNFVLILAAIAGVIAVAFFGVARKVFRDNKQSRYEAREKILNDRLRQENQQTIIDMGVEQKRLEGEQQSLREYQQQVTQRQRELEEEQQTVLEKIQLVKQNKMRLEEYQAGIDEGMQSIEQHKKKLDEEQQGVQEYKNLLEKEWESLENESNEIQHKMQLIEEQRSALEKETLEITLQKELKKIEEQREVEKLERQEAIQREINRQQYEKEMEELYREGEIRKQVEKLRREAEVQRRYEELRRKDEAIAEEKRLAEEARRNAERSVSRIDGMEGHEFEHFCADLLSKNGFMNVQVTRGSGDQGVDILAEKDGIKYAVQCKNYATRLGNTPIQEVSAGRMFYNCHVGAVMTNSTFTQSACDLATSTNVLLWDRDVMRQMMIHAYRN